MIRDRKPKQRRHRLIKFRHRETEYWKNSDEMHDILHRLPDYFKSLLPELLDMSMSREEIMAHMKRLQMATGEMVIDDVKKGRIDRDIQFAVKQGVLEDRDEKYELTPGAEK